MSQFKWIPNLDERESISSTSTVAFPFLLTIIGFNLDSKLLRVALILPITYFAIQNCIAYDCGDVGANFGLASGSFYLILETIDRFWCRDLDNLLRDGEDRIPSAIFGRFSWSLQLKGTMRFAGWQKNRVLNCPAVKKDQSRIQFILYSLFRSFIAYLTIDILSTYFRASPYIQQTLPISLTEFLLASPAQFLLHTLFGGMIGCAALTLLYDSLCIICVTLQIYSVHECPSLFGSISDAYSIRGFWGKSWHQCFRGTIGNISNEVAQLFFSNSMAKSMMILMIAFFLSGILHAISSYSMTHQHGLNTFYFFMSQSIGVALESFISNYFKAAGEKKKGGMIWKLIGFVWTFTFICFTGSGFLDDLIRGGMFRINLAPFSFYSKVTQGTWWI